MGTTFPDPICRQLSQFRGCHRLGIGIAKQLFPMLRSLCLIVAIATAAGSSCLHAQEAQFQQARQAGVVGNLPTTYARTNVATQPVDFTTGGDTESFGVQQLLRENEKQRLFRAFAQVTALVTNNVALAHVDTHSDALLLATFGLEYRRPVAPGWRVEAYVQGAVFRYNEYNVLDFNSFDTGVGLVRHFDPLGGFEVFARYNFNALTDTKSADLFLHSHTLSVGAQKAIAFNSAHGVYFGVAAQTSFTDPESQERSEFPVYAGYHLQATRHLEADALYRYAFIPYNKGGRKDHNQTVSLSLRYRFNDWLSATGAGYASWNESNIEPFSYDDGKLGAGLTLDVRF
jgi:hypothetical protein